MSLEPFEIDPDIRRARTPPGGFYTDPAWYERLRARLFPRAWSFVGDARDLPRPGSARPATLLPGCLDEPLALVRDGEGEVGCLSNACTHRGNLVVTAPCEARALRCGYHGRRFGLDGRCLGMPEFAHVVGFPGPEDDLPRVALGRWGPLLFASLDPARPWTELIAPVLERAGWFDPDGLALDPATSRDYDVPAGWACYVDNYLEGFHIPYVHPALNATLEWTAYRTELLAAGVLQVGVAGPDEPAFALPPGSPDAGQRVGAYYFWLLPTTMLNLYPWGLSLNVVEPQGVDRCRVRFLSYVRDPALRARGPGAGLDAVELEDEAVVGQVQRGLRARLYRRGRYSPAQERGVHHFHRLLLEALG